MTRIMPWALGMETWTTDTYQRRAILMGVVRQEVNRSAGRSGIMGSSSCASHAASWMQFFIEGGKGIWASGWFGLIAATYRRTQKDSGLADTSRGNTGHQEEQHGTSKTGSAPTKLSSVAPNTHGGTSTHCTLPTLSC